MVIAYGTSENWRWNGSREVIEFTVLDEARPILCHLSRECMRTTSEIRVAPRNA